MSRSLTQSTGPSAQLTAVLDALGAGTGTPTDGRYYHARCPSHDDRQASLSIWSREDGSIALKCFAGCTRGPVWRALALFPDDPTKREVASYDYCDPDNNMLYQVVRYEPKTFRPWRHDSGWHLGLGNGPKVLYRLPELLASPPEVTVFFVEGEKDADNLAKVGLVATTSQGGAKGWAQHGDEYAEMLTNRRVVILPDNDDAGRDYASEVVRSLIGNAADVRVLELPDLPAKGDVSDWLASGGTAEELADLAGGGSPGVEWLSESNTGREGAGSAADASRLVHQRPTWPTPLGGAAYHGLGGTFVKLLGPTSEADPVALLAQFLAAVGNVVGAGPHFSVEADRHSMKLFVVLVGETSKARKGSSWQVVLGAIRAVDPVWAEDHVRSGLSSGEGLIWQVRDPITKHEPIKQKGIVTSYQDVEVDPGVQDKRLLVIEQEFASTLRVMERDGNTLSPVVRQAWDRGDLRTLTKNSPAQATGAHISLIGHITKDELRRYLYRTELGNGFANRILWLGVRRSKLLPLGGPPIPLEELKTLIQGLRDAVAFALQNSTVELQLDEEARVLWVERYPQLSEGKPGLFGSVTSRAEAQVLRLAAIYALLDRSLMIQRVHLEAGLEVWRYAEESARFIWGDALGDPLADELLELLRARPDGLTRTEISGMVFGGHHSAEKIGAVLTQLVERGLAYSEREDTGGRPAERWRVTTGSRSPVAEMPAEEPENPNADPGSAEPARGGPGLGSDGSHVSLSSQFREASANLPCLNCKGSSKCATHDDRF